MMTGPDDASRAAALASPPVPQAAHSPRPIIAIACAVVPARWGPWTQPAAVVAADYVHAVHAAGGVAIVVPPDPLGPGAILDIVDGVMLTGGSDLDACAYGGDPHPEAEPPDPTRDAFEVALVLLALARGIPLLGICRGMQVMNVALGGDLAQHLPESLGTEEHRRTTGTFDGNDHLVVLEPGSLAARAAGESPHRVPSHHHQAVDRPGVGVVLTGWSEDDGVPEALEVPGPRYALGVQWHPEADPSSRVIPSLIEAARGA